MVKKLKVVPAGCRADAPGHVACDVWTGAIWLHGFQVPLRLFRCEAISEDPGECGWCGEVAAGVCPAHEQLNRLRGI